MSPESRISNSSLSLIALATAAALAGCTESNRSVATQPHLTMAEARLTEAGGPSPAATMAGVPRPVAAPQPLSSRALTDAGPITVLGKQWLFDRIEGYNRELPGPPKSPGLLLSRSNGRAVGSTSCNRMSATFAINPARGTLHFPKLWVGHSLCGEPNVSTEAAVLHAMRACDSFRLVGNRLALISHGTIVAELVTP